MISDDDFHNQLQAWLIPMAQLDPEPRTNGRSLEVEAKFSDHWIGLRENLKTGNFLFFFTRKYGEIWRVRCKLSLKPIPMIRKYKTIIPSQSQQPTI